MLLDGFSLSPDFPQYYPCARVLDYATLWYQGYPIVPSLLPTLENMATPTYLANHATMRFMVDPFYARQLTTRSSMLSYWDVHRAHRQFDTFDAGLAYLSEQLASGHPVIVGGTPYFLPHFVYYQQPNYVESYNPPPPLGISNHFILVYGLEADSVYIFDPVPHRIKHPIGLNDFAGFWKTDRGIPGLEQYPGIDKLQMYSAFTLDRNAEGRGPRDVDLRPLAYHALRVNIRHYLDAPTRNTDQGTYTFGTLATERLLDDLALYAPANEELAATFELCLLWSRHARFFFRDLLESLVTAGETTLWPYLTQAQHVAAWWDEVHTRYALRLRRRQPLSPDWLAELRHIVQLTSQEEIGLRTTLLRALDAFGLDPSRVE